MALHPLKCCHAGDETARARGTQKSVLERRAPPTFPLVIEMRERVFWVTHWVEDSVDCLLTGKVPIVQVGSRLGPWLLDTDWGHSCTASANAAALRARPGCGLVLLARLAKTCCVANRD